LEIPEKDPAYPILSGIGASVSHFRAILDGFCANPLFKVMVISKSNKR